MLNAILTTMILSLLFDMIFRKKKVSTSLNCGIFAWTGDSTDQFSPFLFNVLGVYNDERGGDSCGVYFNRSVIHGIGAEKKYEDLTKSQKLHSTVRPGKWPVVIGHCRKASSGLITESNAQPVLVRHAVTNKLQYVQAHNGTITNYKDLAEKYKVEVVTGESDSNVLAKLVQKKGFDVLKEYDGSAALVMHFINEPNSLYVFHGMSKQYTVVTEERPLHFIHIKGSGTYISSEARPLEFIANGAKATSFKYNVVYKVTGNTIEEVKKIDRETSVLKKSTVTVYNNSTPAHNANQNAYGYGNQHGRHYTERDYRTYDDGGIDELPFGDKDKKEPTLTGYSTKGVVSNIISSDVDESIGSLNSNKIVYRKGFYYMNDVLVHGRFQVDNWGWNRSDRGSAGNFKVYILYFFYGILLTNREAWEDMKEQAQKEGIYCSVDAYITNRFSKISEKLYVNALHPFTRKVSSPGSGYMEQTVYYPNDKGYETSSFYCGTFNPLFSSIEYEFSEGDFIAYSRRKSPMTILEFLAENEYFEEMGFAMEKEAEETVPTTAELQQSLDVVVIKSCQDCQSHNYHKGGERCFKCDVDLPTTDEAEKKKLEYRKSLLHTIATNVPSIVDDLEQTIGEIEGSGNKSAIQDEYEILVDANKKLKELNL